MQRQHPLEAPRRHQGADVVGQVLGAPVEERPRGLAEAGEQVVAPGQVVLGHLERAGEPRGLGGVDPPRVEGDRAQPRRVVQRDHGDAALEPVAGQRPLVDQLHRGRGHVDRGAAELVEHQHVPAAGRDQPPGRQERQPPRDRHRDDEVRRRGLAQRQVLELEPGLLDGGADVRGLADPGPADQPQRPAVLDAGADRRDDPVRVGRRRGRVHRTLRPVERRQQLVEHLVGDVTAVGVEEPLTTRPVDRQRPRRRKPRPVQRQRVVEHPRAQHPPVGGRQPTPRGHELVEVDVVDPLEVAGPRDVVGVDLEGGDTVGLGEVERVHAGVGRVVLGVVERDDRGQAGQGLARERVLLEQLHRGVERLGRGARQLVEDQHEPVVGVLLAQLVEDRARRWRGRRPRRRRARGRRSPAGCRPAATW